MSEIYEHNQGDHEDPLSGPTWTVGVVGVILLVVICLGTAAIFYSVFAAELDRKVINQPHLEYEQNRAENLERLDGPPRYELRPDLPEGEKALVIPIEQAMSAMAQEAQSGQ
jgi:hypothetical protein